MKLIPMINIDEKKKLTLGQGHKVKGQVQTCSIEEKLVLRINFEGMIGSSWYWHIWFIQLRRLSWQVLKVKGQVQIYIDVKRLVRL